MLIKAHPTIYAGVTFRSRLEATWAAFFDLANLRWEYEPVDLDGWVPDFALWTAQPIYVEVKPAPLVLVWPGGPATVAKDFDGFRKAEAYWEKCWVLLLGCAPNDHADYFGIGRLMDRKHYFHEWFDAQKPLLVKDAAARWAMAKSKTQWVPA